MSDVTVSLDETQAQTILASLEHWHTQLPRSERAQCKALTKKFKELLVVADGKNIEEETYRRIEAILDKMSGKVATTLSLVKKRGMTQETVDYINGVAKLFSGADNKLRSLIDNMVVNTRSAKKQFEADQLHLAAIEKTIAAIVPKIEALSAAFVAEKRDTFLKADRAYTLADRRQAMAQRCFNSGVAHARLANSKADSEIVTRYLTDAADMVNLGVALLHGREAGIRKALKSEGLDTLPHVVLEFADYANIRKV